MVTNFRKVALIPSLEPDDKIVKLVEELAEHDFYIVVVDDGSGDRYRHIFEQISKYAHVIGYEKNKGKGYALRMGFKYIKSHVEGRYITLTMDSDGQHAVEDAINLFEICSKNSNAIILGKRELGQGIPFKSRLGNNITRFLYKAKLQEFVYDTQTGLRAFSDELTDFCINVDGERYIYEMKVIMGAEICHIPIIEEPIQTIYIDNNSGSHFRPFKDSFSLYGSMIAFDKNKARNYMG